MPPFDFVADPPSRGTDKLAFRGGDVESRRRRTLRQQRKPAMPDRRFSDDCRRHNPRIPNGLAAITTVPVIGRRISGMSQGSSWRKRLRQPSAAIALRAARPKSTTVRRISSLSMGRGTTVSLRPEAVMSCCYGLTADAESGAFPPWKSGCPSEPVCQSCATIPPPARCAVSVTMRQPQNCVSFHRPGTSVHPKPSLVPKIVRERFLSNLKCARQAAAASPVHRNGRRPPHTCGGYEDALPCRCDACYSVWNLTSRKSMDTSKGTSTFCPESS